MSTPPVINPITEDEIVEFLLNTPDFFERHTELTTAVQLTSPHGRRAVSLQERQAEMLREKIKVLELRIMEMVRHGNENMVIADRLQRWARALFLVPRAVDLPAAMVSELQTLFGVPQVALRVWGVAPVFAGEPFVQGVSEDVRSLATSLASPYCGVNAGFECLKWLPDPASAASVALIALRADKAAPACGLLVLASPDAHRFQADMGTDFLERMAELGGAALSRLRHVG